LNRPTAGQRVYYVLRIAAAMCFIGHGAFGLITKPVWCNYFGVFGIGQDLAYRLMPLVGSLDLLFGICMLFYPFRGVAAWLVIWGTVTASLRPLSGEPFAEFVERAGNFGAPLALLLLTGPPGEVFKGWFRTLDSGVFLNDQVRARVFICLRFVVFLLLLGHGWLNLMEKQDLINQYASMGFSNPAQFAHVLGIVEILSGIAILVRPSRPLIAVLFIWKMTSELFYPHYGFFEWIERGGSYGSILGLWFVMDKSVSSVATDDRISRGLPGLSILLSALLRDIFQRFLFPPVLRISSRFGRWDATSRKQAGTRKINGNSYNCFREDSRTGY
jgi:uncharacterized membrane protein YphA (DoxX/SURF4 family)